MLALASRKMLVTVARANKMLRLPVRQAAVVLAAARTMRAATHQINGRGSDLGTLPRRFSRGRAEPQAAAVAEADRKPVAAAAGVAAQQTTKSGSRPGCACCT